MINKVNAPKLEIEIAARPITNETKLTDATRRLVSANLEKNLRDKVLQTTAPELRKLFSKSEHQEERSSLLDFAEALNIMLQRQLYRTKPLSEAEVSSVNPMEAILLEALKEYEAKAARLSKLGGNPAKFEEGFQKLVGMLKALETELGFSEALAMAYAKIKLLGRQAKSWAETQAAHSQGNIQFEQNYWERRFIETLAAELAAIAREELGK